MTSWLTRGQPHVLTDVTEHVMIDPVPLAGSRGQ